MNCPHEALDAIAADVERIRDLQRWAHADGYWPKGSNPDRVSGMLPRDLFDRDDPTPTEKSEEELLRELEAKYKDLGIGDSVSRAAFWKTAKQITYVDLRLVAALVDLGHYRQPAAVALNPMSTLAERDLVLAASTIRVGFIRAVWADTPRADHRNARRNLDEPHITPPSARAAADDAVRILTRALSRGPTAGLATAEPYCIICLIREATPKTGGRCTICYGWKQRNRGQERPRKLDDEELAGPHQAAARRRARGEGWGAA